MKTLSLILLLLLSLGGTSMAQAAENAVPMADKLREDGKIWVVVAVIAIVFAGIAINMLRIDAKLRKIEKDLNIK
ncbi:CcmD family protein [Dyadobacter sandarakinus]|uniref:CcmD family protein n=1 Tax=Dyadobacter sandarakinus TaxID=2747268 RepID=A0ABX7I892_9BACT|nr:CcmD family protein [Dyadobacter sandarakinus]QRR01692.1 CcmD family protein [Dyadobacter sandarakinus]